MNYILLKDINESQSYEEALHDKDASKWELAMQEEINSLFDIHIRESIKLLVGKKDLHKKWV